MNKDWLRTLSSVLDLSGWEGGWRGAPFGFVRQPPRFVLNPSYLVENLVHKSIPSLAKKSTIVGTYVRSAQCLIRRGGGGGVEGVTPFGFVRQPPRFVLNPSCLVEKSNAPSLVHQHIQPWHGLA